MSVSRWHARRDAVARVLTDLITSECARLRPGGSPLPSPPWPPDIPLGAGGLELDSLERYTLGAVIVAQLALQDCAGAEHLPLASSFDQLCAQVASALAQDGSRLVFRTSGSTGSPKACEHRLLLLEQEADALARCIGPRTRVFLAVPAHHIYGFIFGVLLPERLGALEVIDARTLTPQSLARQLTAGDLLVSHPSHWSLLARFAGAFAADVLGVTSSAPCPDSLCAELQSLGLARLIQIYGSSETAGLGWRDRPDQPYLLMPYWQRTPDGLHGEMTLRRPAPQGGWVVAAVQDVLVWHADGRFEVSGRRDEAVQVAGINVFPSRVREVIAAHPEVAACAVRLMAPAEGDRLKAYVVPIAGIAPERLLPALESWTRERLTAAECPRAWTFGDRLPTSASGKPADWPLVGLR